MLRVRGRLGLGDRPAFGNQAEKQVNKVNKRKEFSPGLLPAKSSEEVVNELGIERRH